MIRLIDWLQKAFFYLLIQGADRFGKKDVPVREALTGPSAEEVKIQKRYNRALSDRIDMKVKRAVRPATREEILASQDHKRAMALIRDAGGC